MRPRGHPRRMADGFMRLPRTCRTDRSGYVPNAESTVFVAFGAMLRIPLRSQVPWHAHW